ncbi:MAG: fused MFS/spermidine synthase [Stagnimonas sp.]|nr:fused MFS/spermidine synthase [Stagnimonas sp.]
MTDRDSRLRALLYLLFACSGFAGLIYESVWAQYLKLFLGHAAYAQTLVLMIFMGGMALGAWLVGRYTERLPQPLLAYAAVELLLGVMALLFDRSFRGVQDWIYDAVIPTLESGTLIELAKWTAAGSLILPQSILLGATFPLMSAGILRLSPSISGRALSWLYFSNSLGAVFGVLTSGFVLIALVGLPGTSLTAGLVNIALAAAVWVLARTRAPSAATGVGAIETDPSETAPPVAAPPRLLLWTALLTGAASFLYEIGWIRMLSLVLGSSTHAFELMLAAFILGLALGSFAIRGRIQGLRDPVRALGLIQVAMGLLAVGSAFAYIGMFDLMAWLLAALARTPQGYGLFNAGSWLICGLVMLPATVCAGMTLPLITHSLLRGGAGESAIGRVYAFNTLGAILGVLVAVHLAMPWIGVKNTLLLGAAIDVGLGFWLLRGRPVARPAIMQLVTLACLLVFLSGALFRLDPQRLTSGVFRTGEAVGSGKVLYHRDGKTATVSVLKELDGSVMISTNGKPDAQLRESPASLDDYTMILLGTLPQLAVPDLREVAVIGFGSGRSTHVLLQNPDIQRVDTVEIEPVMVEGAKAMGRMARSAFEDPRSHIHYEDAKTFFARSQRRYDVIVSEPSNPWVSGVSGLFSVEYYRRLKTHLSEKGVLVQWLHAYELDMASLATVLKALDETFADFRIYFSLQGDWIVVADPDGPLAPLDYSIVGSNDEIRRLLASVEIKAPEDLLARAMGDKASLAAWIAQQAPRANSDYFPLLDQRASRSRFLRLRSNELTEIRPYLALYHGDEIDTRRLTATRAAWHLEDLYAAAAIEAALATPTGEQGEDGGELLLPEVSSLIDTVNALPRRCDRRFREIQWPAAYAAFHARYGLLLRPQALQTLVRRLRPSACPAPLPTAATAWLDLSESLAQRDWSVIGPRAEALIAIKGAGAPDDSVRYLLALARRRAGDSAGADQALREIPQERRSTALTAWIRALDAVSR